MNNDSIIFIGFDTHKPFIQIATLKDERGAKPENYGRINCTKTAIEKFSRLCQFKFPNTRLHFIYEADPCGYWIYRLLTSLGHCCYVGAPSLIPKKSGDSVKTDKRDTA